MLQINQPIELILDRHHAWRSQDPTLDICSNFVKKSIYLPFFFCFFFKKDATFYKSASFLLHLVIHLVIHQVIRPVTCPVIHPVIYPVIHPVIRPVIRPVICPVIRPVIRPVFALTSLKSFFVI